MNPITRVLDTHYLTYFQENTNLEDRWLLLQNLALTGIRRQIIDALDIQPGQQVLDLGCGFGVFACDLAARVPVHVEAIDVSPHKVACAEAIVESILASVGTLPGDISFQIDDGYSLSLENNRFDWVISQHVFQHLEQPQEVIDEVFRVLKPGGQACIIDVDDGLSLSYPEHAAFGRLGKLLMEVQERRGGDRRIGRKLPNLLHDAGFTVQSAVPLVQAEFLAANQKALMLQAMAQHFTDVREEAVSEGLISGEEFDALIHQFVNQPLPHTFEVDVQFIVAGQKPLSA